jgi:hypothetical protein
MLLPIVAGAVLGGLFVLFAARKGSRAEARFLAAGLVVAALIYLVLALVKNGGDWLAIEVGGVALFGALAWQGMRGAPWFLVVGWLSHVAWDAGLHLDRASPIAPEWYPLLCVGFDLIVAGFVVGRISPALELRHRDSRSP